MSRSTKNPLYRDYSHLPWNEIRSKWESGIKPSALSIQYNVPQPQIRKRASLYQWARPGTIRGIIQAKAKELVEKRLDKESVDIGSILEKQIRECIRECVATGRAIVKRVKRSTEDCENGEISGLAQAFRAGMEGWRISLGLNSGSETQVNIAIKVGPQSTEPVAESEPTIEV
jgi:hypothetical protein